MATNDSSRWTGAPEQPIPRAGIFLRRHGDPHFASDYHRLAEAHRDAASLPREVRGVSLLGLLLAIVGPLMLWAAWGLMGALTNDFVAEGNGPPLFGWGGAMVALGVVQFRSRSRQWVPLRRALLIAGLATTFGISGTYVYAGVTAHTEATSAAPERAFQFCRGRGGRAFLFRRVECRHQRADGSTLEGRMTAPVAHGSTCVLAQRLDGANGFSWVRVLERSRAPERGQLTWGIRPEQCFSTTPLSELPA